MITANTIAGIESLFVKSVQDSCVVELGDHCVVRHVESLDSPAESARRKLVVLNISSYVFRIVILFDFDTDAATIAHLAKIARSTEEKMEGQALLDAYAEFANMICGAVNRSLCAQFRHVGMSTPFFLESACVQYVSMLNPTQVQAFEVVINDSVRFDFTVCLCVADDVTLDFNVAHLEQADSSNGELELF